MFACVIALFFPTTVEVEGRFGLSESVVNFHMLAVQMMVLFAGIVTFFGGVFCYGIASIVRALRAHLIISAPSQEEDVS